MTPTLSGNSLMPSSWGLLYTCICPWSAIAEVGDSCRHGRMLRLSIIPYKLIEGKDESVRWLMWDRWKGFRALILLVSSSVGIVSRLSLWESQEPLRGSLSYQGSGAGQESWGVPWWQLGDQFSHPLIYARGTRESYSSAIRPSMRYMLSENIKCYISFITLTVATADNLHLQCRYFEADDHYLYILRFFTNLCADTIFKRVGRQWANTRWSDFIIYLSDLNIFYLI